MTGQQRPLTSLQQRLVETGGRQLKHDRYYWLLLAASHLTRQLFTPTGRRGDLRALLAGWAIRRPDRISVTRDAGAQKVSEARVQREAASVFRVLAIGTNLPFRCLWQHLVLQTRLTIAVSHAQEYVIGRAGGL